MNYNLFLWGAIRGYCDLRKRERRTCMPSQEGVEAKAKAMVFLAPLDGLADLGGLRNLLRDEGGDNGARSDDGRDADVREGIGGAEAGDLADCGPNDRHLNAAELPHLPNKEANDGLAHAAADLLPRSGEFNGQHRELVTAHAVGGSGLQRREERNGNAALLEGHRNVLLIRQRESQWRTWGSVNGGEEGTEVKVEGAKVEVKGGLAGGELDSLGLVAGHGERAGGEGRDEGNGGEELLHGFGWNVMM